MCESFLGIITAVEGDKAECFTLRVDLDRDQGTELFKGRSKGFLIVFFVREVLNVQIVEQISRVVRNSLRPLDEISHQ